MPADRQFAGSAFLRIRQAGCRIDEEGRVEVDVERHLCANHGIRFYGKGDGQNRIVDCVCAKSKVGRDEIDLQAAGALHSHTTRLT